MSVAHDVLTASPAVRAARAELLGAATGSTLLMGAAPAAGLLPGATSVTSWDDSAVLAEGAFECAVCVLSLCQVDDQAGFLRRLRDLLAPGGRLLFLEHVRGPHPIVRLQRLYGPTWRVAAGCRLAPDTVAAVRAAGFVVTDLERLAPAGRLTSGTVVSGRAIARLTPQEDQ